VTIDELLDLDPVVPVAVIDDPADAVPLARALVDGGVHTIEVTLRTPAALAAIERIAGEVPEILVGAGTVISEAQLRGAAAAGAQFAVSPGSTPCLLDALAASGLPFLAGCATPSEIMALLERGITAAKLFPAAAVGGVAAALALAGPFPDVRLCPTGGIDMARAAEYLRLPNVACVGASWITRGPHRSDGDRDRVVSLARAACELRRPQQADVVAI
jgi:2-dehydro-3-deoxyphosphogluconate aldolase / (4S)-4-hydroxy-2-oxoglutarate aldolase